MSLLARMPLPHDRRMAVRVGRAGLRSVRSGHPWLFENSIESVSHEGAPGDLAVVFDDHRRFAGIGLWDPGSVIRVRMLHAGRPTQIDAAFWHARLAKALELRAPLVADGRTTGYRWINGENDGFGGLVVDRYGDHLVMKLYTDVWLPHLASIVDGLVALAPSATVIVRATQRLASGGLGAELDGATVVGEAPDGPVGFSEHGLLFEADLLEGQKTGHFLDQRHNRRLVSQAALGASVLDVFSCNGGFSVHAAAGGARSVHLVDLSPGAIRNAHRNLDLNAPPGGVEICRREATVGDAFEVMSDLVSRGERFGVVVVDPPSFARRRAHVPGALRAYTRLAELGARLTDEGGLLVACSCSAQVQPDDFGDAVRRGITAAGSKAVSVSTTGHDVDHPVTFPEGGYLKAVHARLRRR